MRIEIGFPPNIAEIGHKFPELKDFPTAVFTHDGTLYNPSGLPIPKDLMAHEEVHAVQQRDFGSAEAWWEEYLRSDGFRLKQEAQAYQVQARYLEEHCDREYRRRIMKHIISNLSSGLYGKMITKEEAKNLLQ